jgi:hypothetical protein
MKFVSILAVASTMFGLANGQASLAQKWNISEDASFDYSSLSFKLGYTVSDFVSEATTGEMAKFVIFDDGCKNTGSEISANSTSGLTTITPDLTAQLTGAMGDVFNMNCIAFVNICGLIFLCDCMARKTQYDVGLPHSCSQTENIHHVKCACIKYPSPEITMNVGARTRPCKGVGGLLSYI